MSTVIVIPRFRRQPDPEMFADMGFTGATFDFPATPSEVGWVTLTFTQDLTAAQILAVKIRLQTPNGYQENLLNQAVVAIDKINTWNALTPSQKAVPATAIAAVDTLAQICKGLILWAGKDANPNV